MKTPSSIRNYRTVTSAQTDQGWGVNLDQRPLLTPAGHLLLVPTKDLGTAIAGEWDRQRERIDPAMMAMTQIANSAIDHIRPDPAPIAGQFRMILCHDMLCYRSDDPALAARQSQKWQPWLDWAKTRYDASFISTDRLIAIDQPDATIQRIMRRWHGFDHFQQAVLMMFASGFNSAILAFALAEGALDSDQAFTISQLEVHYQMERWGREAKKLAETAKLKEIHDGRRFLDLLRKASEP
ncbi:MAG: ATP12 family protein [Pseudomonadota bacterium]